MNGAFSHPPSPVESFKKDGGGSVNNYFGDDVSAPLIINDSTRVGGAKAPFIY